LLIIFAQPHHAFGRQWLNEQGLFDMRFLATAFGPLVVAGVFIFAFFLRLVKFALRTRRPPIPDHFECSTGDAKCSGEEKEAGRVGD
jgi:hypothetical protein